MPPAPPPLTISSFTPSSAAKDSLIQITGTGFSTNTTENKVKFGDGTAEVTAATTTTLTIKVPQHASNGKITVDIGSRTATSADDFSYIYTVSTLAGNGDTFGLEVDAAGNIYAADEGGHIIRKITPQGQVSTIAGTGALGFKNGDALTATFNSPIGLAIDGAGNVYVADAGNNLIRKITPQGQVSTLAGSGDKAFKDGMGAEAAFNFPYDLAIDPNGNLFVTDGSNHRIRKITPAGLVTTLPGDAPSGFAEFSFPEGIAIDKEGNLFIADAAGARIYKIDNTGKKSLVSSDVTLPEGIAVDRAGNLFIGDIGASSIRKISPAGFVSTIAGTGHLGYAEGLGPVAQFSEPSPVAVDAAGNIYVGDVGNARIRRLQ